MKASTRYTGGDVLAFLHAVVVSGTLHVCVSQTDRGELAFGASVGPFWEFAEGRAAHVRELMPALSRMRRLGAQGLRAWQRRLRMS